VIVGHSERRTLYGEDDHTVAAKAKAVLGFGMKPVICVGETLADRQAGSTEDVVGQQVDIVLDHLGVAAMRSSVVAYEPVWAIGTGHTATPEQAQAVHEFIRRKISARNPEVGRRISILYGGSVKASNAAGLFDMPDIDGGLIGGASLDAAEFAAICQAADRETLERV
jgi:triosephosphate isomerase